MNMETNKELTTLATCWLLKLRDGTTLGFTEADRDLIIEGVNYASKTGFSRSAIASNNNLAVDNLNVEGILDSDLITHEDLLSGRFDYAEVQIFMVDFLNTDDGKRGLRTGWIGEVSIIDGKFNAEIRGLFQAFSQNLGDLYSPQCRAKLGDSKCKINLEKYAYAGEIQSIISEDEIVDFKIEEADGFYKYGTIEFESGHKSDIESHFSGRLVLNRPHKEAYVGERFKLYPGCDKNFETCIEKFHNGINFRGEPFIPEPTKVLF
jgi:uncharacterized phage protein (TIGR02218 family)